MSLGCPVCRVPLHEIANRVGVAAACATCGGIWLDNACSRSVVQNLLEPAVKYGAQQADAIAAKRAAEGSTGGYREPAARAASDDGRVCAVCSKALARSVFEPARLALDVCSAHGTWFDAGELWTMCQHFDMKAAMDDADAVAFGQEMQAYRNAEMASDFRAAGMLAGFLRR